MGVRVQRGRQAGRHHRDRERQLVRVRDLQGCADCQGRDRVVLWRGSEPHPDRDLQGRYPDVRHLCRRHPGPGRRGQGVRGLGVRVQRGRQAGRHHRDRDRRLGRVRDLQGRAEGGRRYSERRLLLRCGSEPDPDRGLLREG